MAKVQHGLGKGLGALLGDETPDLRELRKPVGYINKEVVGTTEKQDTSDVLRIPVEMIEPNPFQPRMSFDPEALQELADSVRTFGLIQPITVRKRGAKYQIISGERRYRACTLAGMEMIPAYIRDANDQGMLEMAIVENIQRENLDPIEVAMSYQCLMEECRLTQEQMADRVGKKRASVANQLRLLKLPAKVQHDLKVGLVSVGHAKVLLGVEDPKMQESLCDLIVRGGLSVRQLEEKVKALEKGENLPAAEKEPQELPEMYYRLLENVGRIFGENISLRRNANGKGSMTIKFDSDAQMERFLQALDPNRG
ncbi:MAG: ParB/RepB/Spo0J family partition protein [Bacteroidales bacterium]|nr:ParB/RepB/Spo0J family partition protein [Bacteroidales bacterium]